MGNVSPVETARFILSLLYYIYFVGGVFVFSQNETVVYGAQGICKIRGTARLEQGRQAREYYVLIPVYDEGSVIYVPTDNEKLVSNIRRLLSPEEIDRLIDETAATETQWIDDNLERKEYCSDVMKSGDRKQLMQLIDMLYLHRRDLKQSKKHFHVTDERCLREAERLINDEFSFVLGISREEVPSYIINRLHR